MSRRPASWYPGYPISAFDYGPCDPIIFLSSISLSPNLLISQSRHLFFYVSVSVFYSLIVRFSISVSVLPDLPVCFLEREGLAA